jgi:hypothetical protein
VSREGVAHFIERAFGPQGTAIGEVEYRFDVDYDRGA